MRQEDKQINKWKDDKENGDRSTYRGIIGTQDRLDRHVSVGGKKDRPREK